MRPKDSRRRHERAAFKARRARDKEWWKPLACLPERVRIEGRRLVRWIVKSGEAGKD